MEQSSHVARLRDPADLKISQMYELLTMLNNNAEWDQDSDLVDTWLDDPDNLADAVLRQPQLFLS